MVCRKSFECNRCTKLLWFSLIICIVTVFKLSTLYGSKGNAERPVANKHNDETLQKSGRYKGLVKRKGQNSQIPQSSGSVVAFKQGSITSIHQLGSEVKEKQPNVKTKHYPGFDIIKGLEVDQKFTLNGIVNKPSVYTFSGGSWKISYVCKPYKSYQGNINFQIVTSKSLAGSVKMFVHNPQRDSISQAINRRHSFEPVLVDFVVFLLQKDPELSLIDIGTNVGLFTMAAALLGRHVIAVDAVIENIEHVCASVEYQNFTNRVLLINNAFSNSQGKVGIAMGGTGDFGLSHVNENDINSKINRRFSRYFRNGRTISVDAVKFDDLLNLRKFSIFKNLLIKIDVEGNEHRVLLGAKEFMNKKGKYVKGILIEWAWVSGGQSENTILNLMAGWDFYPYRCDRSLSPLNKNNTKLWPKDVLWLPKDTKLTQSTKLATGVKNAA